MEIVAEQWRSAVGYEGFYEVSNIGNVRSLDREVPCRFDGRRVHRGRQLRPNGPKKHYLKVGICVGGTDRTVLVHRLVADAWLGQRPEGTEVNHIDGNKHNNAASNLEYVSKSSNMAHAMSTGLVTVGEKRSAARYTEYQMRRGLELIASGQTISDAAKAVGVPCGRLAKVNRGVIWRHLTANA